MSDTGADQGEMRFFDRHNDSEPHVAAFLHEVRTAYLHAPPADTADRHVASIAAAARATGNGAAPTARRRRASFGPRVLALAALFVLLAAFGGAAYAGRLPGRVQGKVADISNNVGISIPGNENDVDEGDVGNTDQGRRGDTDQAHTGTPERGSQGDTEQRPQGNTEHGSKGSANEGTQDATDEGSKGNTDEGTRGDTEQGSKGDTDEGTRGDAGQGSLGTTDEPAQGRRESDSGEQGGSNDGDSGAGLSEDG